LRFPLWFPESGLDHKVPMNEKKLMIKLAVGLVLLLRLPAVDVIAESVPSSADPSGMVWERHGDWHLNGSTTALRLGEAIPPGGLITAGDKAPSHSLTLLLPDGQRMLCECFDPKTCAQGFRVPQLTGAPSPMTWTMFAGVRTALLQRPADSDAVFPQPKGRAEGAGKFEMVAELSPRGEISIASALRVLPAGQYSLAVTAGSATPVAMSFPSAQGLDWRANPAMAQVRVGGAGLYHVQITDPTHVPRIEIEVLATSPTSYAAEASGLKQTREVIRGWSESQEGWPLHPFLRVYLESRASALSP
jgi:hypothetical protein